MANRAKIFEMLHNLECQVNQIKNKVDDIHSKIFVNDETTTKQFPIKFPLSTEEELKRFEDTLQDKDVFAVYLEHFQMQLKTVRNALTMYSRRKCLKELLFSE